MCLGVGPQAPLCYSSLECHSSLGSAASSCSAEHAVSSRRYDEHWGTVERADCWIKCQRDGRTLHVHSQILCLASPVLRDALALLPRQVEGMAGPVYVITLDVDSTGLTAALDMVYPLGHGADPSWADIERALLVADKYEMGGVTQRCLHALMNPHKDWVLDAGAPNSVLRWLAFTHQLQQPSAACSVAPLQAYLTQQLQRQLPVLARDAAMRSDLITFAAESLDRGALLQLLQAVLDGAALAIPARNRQLPSQRQQACAQQQQQQQLDAAVPTYAKRSRQGGEQLEEGDPARIVSMLLGGDSDREAGCSWDSCFHGAQLETPLVGHDGVHAAYDPASDECQVVPEEADTWDDSWAHLSHRDCSTVQFCACAGSASCCAAPPFLSQQHQAAPHTRCDPAMMMVSEAANVDAALCRHGLPDSDMLLPSALQAQIPPRKRGRKSSGSIRGLMAGGQALPASLDDVWMHLHQFLS